MIFIPVVTTAAVYLVYLVYLVYQQVYQVYIYNSNGSNILTSVE